MIRNGHNPKHYDAGADRDENMRRRESTCAKRVGDRWCLLEPNHEGECRPCGPDELPRDPVDPDELGGEGG